MCLLLFQDLAKHKPITRDQFDKIWDQNPHGGGVGFYRGHEPVILTSMIKDRTWLNYQDAIKQITEYQGRSPSKPKTLILHCRVATHGTPRVMSNCHPFFVPVGTGMLLAHNGCTNHEGLIRPAGWSDTRTLASAWIPKYAPHFLTEEKDMEAIKKQVGGSRVCIMTQWTQRFIGFPAQEKELEEYGMFSNFLWDRKVGKWGGGSICGYNGGSGWKPAFTENPEAHKRDHDRLKHQPNSRYLSEDMAARVLFYAVINNLSFGAALLMMKDIFGDYPSHTTLKELTNHYEKAIDSIATFQDEKITTDWEVIWQQDFYKGPDELQVAWMEANGIDATTDADWEEHPANPANEKQLNIEMDRAVAGEAGEILPQPTGERCLAQTNEKTPENEFPVDPEFPYGRETEQRGIHNDPVKTYGQP